MSLDPPAYISSLQNNIRARPISWEGAVRARTITEGDLKRIKSIDKVRKEQRRQTLDADPSSFVKLFLGGVGDGHDDAPSIFQAASKRQDIIQYLLVLTGDIVDDNPSFVTQLLSHPAPYTPFLPLLTASTNPEDPIPLLTSSVLSALLSSVLASSTKAPPHIDTALPQLQTYLSKLAKSSDSGLQDIAVQAYSSVLRTSRSREIFWEHRNETLNPLMDVLRAAAGAGRDSDSTLMNGGTSIRSLGTETGLGGGVSIQLLYHILLVVWQLSFEGEKVGPGLEADHDIIPLYTHLLRVSPKEKITRLLLSTLQNLSSPDPNATDTTPATSTLLASATRSRLPTTLANLRTRHLTDPDLLSSLQSLQQILTDYSHSQTTFSEYASEIRSGHLRWSPPHTNAAFWKENARRIIEEESGELVKKLAEILGKSWEGEKVVLAVACSDVANLVRECPEKKGVLERAGLKSRVMALMAGDADESVRWEGLRAVGEWMRYSFDG